MEFTSISQAVRHVLDNMPVGTIFYGNQLHEMVVELYPKGRNCYVDTVLKKARQYRRDKFKCLNPAKSKYKRV